jgi:hypothetical protein
MSSVLQFGIYGDERSRNAVAFDCHEIVRGVCANCKAENVVVSRDWSFIRYQSIYDYDLIPAAYYFVRRTRFYLFFALMDQEEYPSADPFTGGLITPRSLKIPVDMIKDLSIHHSVERLLSADNMDQYLLGPCECMMRAFDPDLEWPAAMP